VAAAEAKAAASEAYAGSKEAAQEKYDQMKNINFDDIKSNMSIFPIIILIIAVCCVATPVRKKIKELWNKCLAGDGNEIESVTYESKST